MWYYIQNHDVQPVMYFFLFFHVLIFSYFIVLYCILLHFTLNKQLYKSLFFIFL